MPCSKSCNLAIGLAVSVILTACAPVANQTIVADSARQDSERLISASGKQVELSVIDSFVDTQMRDLDIPGMSIAVISDGQIVYEAAKGVTSLESGEPVTSRSVFEAASLSKPVFAYFVLKFADRGVLDINRPLYEYRKLEELEGDESYQVITTRMALSHQTGFPNWRWFDPAPPERGIERGTMYMKREPGEFGYSGEGYNYVSLVLADLTGNDQTTLDNLYQQEIAAPLGLSCSSFVRTECVAERKVSGHKDNEVSEDKWPQSFPEDTPLTFGAAGRLHTNALDYATIMIAMMKGQGLSNRMLEEFFAEQSRVPRDSSTHLASGVIGWSLGLGMEPTEYGVRYEHGGNNGDFQSGMMFFRVRGLGYVFLTNSDKGQEFNRRLEVCITEGVCQ